MPYIDSYKFGIPWTGRSLFWVGGTDSWNSTAGTKWSLVSGGVGGEPVPTSNDDVYFDSGSGIGTCSITSTSICRSAIFTGWPFLPLPTTDYVGAIDHTSGVWSIYGSLIFTTFMSYTSPTLGLGGGFDFASFTTGNIIKTASKPMRNVLFDSVGGGWTMGDTWNGVNVVSNAEQGIILRHGTLDTGNQTVNATNFFTDGTGVCSLLMGSTTWTTSNAAGINWNVSNPNFTISAGSSTINASNTPGNSNITFAGGGLTYGAVVLNPQANSLHQISGTNTIATLTTNGNASPDCALQFNDDQIIGTWNVNGGDPSTSRLLITTDSYQSPFTHHQVSLTIGIINASNIDVQNINGNGIDLSFISGKSGDCGGNSNIIFTPAQVCYRVSSVSANWGNIAHWATKSGGPVAGNQSRVPLPQDAAIFDGASFSTTGITVTISDVSNNYNRISSFDFTGAASVGGLTVVSPSFVTNGPILSIAGCRYFGDMFFASSSLMTISPSSNPVCIIQSQKGNKILTSGQTLPISILAQTSGATFTQLDNLTVSGITTNAFNISDDSIWDANGFTITVSGTGAATRFVMQNTAQLLNAGNVTISSAAAAFQMLDSSLLDASGSIVTAAGSCVLTGGKLKANSFVRTGLGISVAGSELTIGTGGCACSTFSISSGKYTGAASGLLNCSSTWLQTGGVFTDGGGGVSATTISNTGSVARTCTMAGNWTATSTGTVWNWVSTGLTLNAGGTIKITNTSATTKTVAGGGLIYNDMQISGAASNGTVTITGSNTFHNVTLAALSSILFTAATTTTITGAITATGTSGNLVTMASTSTTNAIISSAGNEAWDFTKLTHMTGTGGGTFTATHSTDGGGNVGITITP